MKRNARVPLLPVGLVVWAFVAPACSDGSSSSPPDAGLPTSPDAAAGEVAGGGQTCNISQPTSSSTADISGTWAARVTGAIVVNAPIIGVVHQQMVLTLLVNVTQQGTDLIVDGRYCNRKQKSEQGALTQVVIPDAWAHTETPIHRLGTYTVGGDGLPVLVMSTFAETMGAVLASPAMDTLPTTPTDTRVIDQDNDGHPGITVYISGLASGTLYAVQRQITSFTAVPATPNRFEGTVQFSTEQNVLGSDPETPAVLYSQAGQSGADPTVASTITMVRLADATVSCECVRANDTALFGP
jgi:hypothetical protein